MISTTGSTCSATSDRTLSTTWSPSSPAVGAGCVSGSIERCRAADRVQDRAPEPLRILLVAVDGHERDATKVGRAVGPRTQQRGLPASRRRRDDRHPLGHGAIQQLEELFPVEQAPGDRNVSRDRLLRVLPALRRHQAGHVAKLVTTGTGSWRRCQSFVSLNTVVVTGASRPFITGIRRGRVTTVLVTMPRHHTEEKSMSAAAARTESSDSMSEMQG